MKQLLHFTAARQSDLSGKDRARFAAMLIDHGARLDIRDDLLKSTPLGWACRWGHRELVELLLQRGAPVARAGCRALGDARGLGAENGPR